MTDFVYWVCRICGKDSKLTTEEDCPPEGFVESETQGLICNTCHKLGRESQ